jgi:hypothetical protein
MHGDYLKAVFTSQGLGCNDDPMTKLTPQPLDLLFDNGDGGFSVNGLQDDRSRIGTMFGEMTWGALKKSAETRTRAAEGARAGSVPASAAGSYYGASHSNNTRIYNKSFSCPTGSHQEISGAISWVNVPYSQKSNYGTRA